MPDRSAAWWEDAVVYQVYPRSFQDSDGDGVGDLPGILRRLDHLAWLGVDAVWLSPIYPSPLADFGYDITDHTAVDAVYGTLADLDGLVAAAHERGIRVLLDFVPSHTSIEHPWFREHPDRYVWADGDGPPNNWRAAFGGPAWSRDERTGRWYLHSFYPEQPDLDWRNPDVVAAQQHVLRFWLARGIDGFRVDAVERIAKDPGLRDDPPATGPPPLPVHGDYAELEHVNSANWGDVGELLAALRQAAGDALLVGEVYLPTRDLARYVEHLDVAFCFELFHARWSLEDLRRALRAAAPLVPRVGWVLSNHDFPRLPARVGEDAVALAAMLVLTLPGVAFVYQGDEIGMGNGPGADPPFDRAGRDAFRHPMQWEPGPGGGFTTGTPWLSLIDPQIRNVAAQRADRASLLWLYRDLIALRRELGPGLRLLGGAGGLIAYARGAGTVVALNLGAEACPLDAWAGHEIVLATRAGAVRRGRLEGRSGAVLRA